MKLSRFPYLVLKEILDHLFINELFFLSLCSKNTKKFIKKAQNKHFEKIEQINYVIYSTVIMIKMKTISERFTSSVMYLVRCKTDFPRPPFSKQYGSVEEVKVNELGASSVFLRCPIDKSYLHAKYCSDNAESTLETIHNSLCDLLGNRIFGLIIMCLENHFIPMLRNIQMIQLFGHGFDSRQIVEFASRSTCLEFFEWYGTFEPLIEFKESSKIFELDTIYTSNPILSKNATKYFRGRHAFLSGHVTNETDVIQLLHEWKSGEKFHNLEVICIDGFFEIHKIRDSVKFKEVNTEVVFSFVRKYRVRDLDSSPTNPWEFRSRFYIVRESDGHVASVMLSTDLFFMGVWQMTEEQFLKTFQ